jgi:hypothetical protein
MPVTIGFQGLCAIVSEKQSVIASGSLDVLLVDAAKAGLHCPHDTELILPAAGLSDPGKLTKVDQKGQILNLAGRQIRFVPIGQTAAAVGFRASNLHLIPEMKLACGIGTVDADCFAMPPQKTPVAGRIHLPAGGTLSSQPGLDEWSFAPPIGNSCYHGLFTWEVLYELPAAKSFLISVETLDGAIVGQLHLPDNGGKLTVNNVCNLEAPKTPSNDTLSYYRLIDPPFSGTDRPMTWNSPDCSIPKTSSPGIGCVPFLMSRT